jgi:hypothetical protein
MEKGFFDELECLALALERHQRSSVAADIRSVACLLQDAENASDEDPLEDLTDIAACRENDERAGTFVSG